MQKVRFVGLDVHKESIAIAVADGDGSAPESVATIPNDTTLLLKRLKKLGAGASLRCCYEAGPTGFVLQRALAAAGIACAVIAPSLVPQKAGDRVKTDSRDAVKLARFLRSGDLTEVHVPEASTEAMRDLERCRDGAKRRLRESDAELAGHEGWISRGGEQVIEAGEELVARGVVQREPSPDARAEGQELGGAEPLGQARVAGEDDAEQLLAVEVLAGEDVVNDASVHVIANLPQALRVALPSHW
jgi:transposase